MRSAVFFLCIVCLALTDRLKFSMADVVDDTCKSTPNVNLCVSTLRADARSAGADVSGLATIMVDVIKKKATDTLNTINGLVGRTPEPGKAALSRCAELYGNAILNADIPSAVEALQTGNPKFAQQGVNDAANEADSCERGFNGSSPITSSNKSVSDLCRVASAIIAFLL